MRGRIVSVGKAAVVLGCLLAGCSEDDPRSSDLSRATSQWRAAAVTDYVFVYQTYCFCDARLVRAVVSDGKIVSATFDDGSSATETAKTVDDWLGYIRETIGRSPAAFSATYDDKYGYPKEVTSDLDDHVSDDELTFTVACFQPSTNDASACPLTP